MVLGLFSKKSALERTIKKATSQYAQSADRVAALESLADNGTHEALVALCKRFSFSAHKMIEDEQEKQLVVELLTGKGESAVEPLHDYMQSAATIAFPLRILERVAEPARRLEVIDNLLESEEPGYTKDTTRRIQIIEWLGEQEDADADEVTRRVAPYLTDFDENVRIAAAEALALKPCDAAAEPLVTALLREDEESFRVRRRLAEILADNELSLCGRKTEVAELLEERLSDFRLHRDKLARKK